MIIPVPSSPNVLSKLLQNCKCLCVINCCSAEIEMIDSATQTPPPGSTEWNFYEGNGLFINELNLTHSLVHQTYQSFHNHEDIQHNPERQSLLYHK